MGKKVIDLKQTDPCCLKKYSGVKNWLRLSGKTLPIVSIPQILFNEETLRRAFEQPTGSLTDFIRVALGWTFLTRDERIEKGIQIPGWQSTRTALIRHRPRCCVCSKRGHDRRRDHYATLQQATFLALGWSDKDGTAFRKRALITK